MSEQSSTSDQGSDKLAEVSLFVDPAIEKLLVENQTDLVTLLRRNDLAVERSAVTRPQASRGEKEPATIIIATAALIAALTPTVSRILEKLSHKPVLVEELAPVPIEDSDGNPVRDAAGNPMIEWVPRQRLIERQVSSESESYSISGPLGLKISYKRSTSDEQ